MQFISFRILMSRIKAIKTMMHDKTVPKRKKALDAFANNSMSHRIKIERRASDEKRHWWCWG